MLHSYAHEQWKICSTILSYHTDFSKLISAFISLDFLTQQPSSIYPTYTYINILNHYIPHINHSAPIFRGLNLHQAAPGLFASRPGESNRSLGSLASITTYCVCTWNMLKHIEITQKNQPKKCLKKVVSGMVQVLDSDNILTAFWQPRPALIFSFDWSKDRLWLASTKASWNIASNEHRAVQGRAKLRLPWCHRLNQPALNQHLTTYEYLQHLTTSYNILQHVFNKCPFCSMLFHLIIPKSPLKRGPALLSPVSGRPWHGCSAGPCCSVEAPKPSSTLNFAERRCQR